ncbi:MAG: DUF4209 domain-containing protein [bacterium]|nr:DUF4209 domain-containing protein [bacterium]
MTLTIEQFEKIVVPLCMTAKRKRCQSYSTALQKPRLEAKPESEEFAIISLFERIFSFHLRPDSPGEAFGPMLQMEGKRSAIPADLTKEQREFLATLLPKVADEEMRARIADTLWELKHGKATFFASEAVRAYLTAAEQSEEDGWRYEADHYARTLRIYASMKRADKDGELGIVVTDKLLQAAKNSSVNGHPYLTMKLVGLLNNSGIEGAIDFVSIISEIAEKFENEGNFNAAHDAWLLLGRLYHSDDKFDKVTYTATRAADTFVKMADASEREPNPSYMQICSWLQSAVSAYRQIKGGKERADELYLRLASLQPRIHGEMQRHSVNIDITESVKEAIAHVSDRNALGAIMAAAFYRFPSSREALQKHVAEKAEAGPLAHMLAATYHDKHGRVVARKELEEPEENHLHRAAAEIRSMQPALFIRPALAQIRFEHAISFREWVDFLHSHPFVPEHSRMTYARGLYHGFHGDYVAAACILMPQVEKSLRHILKEAGEETSKLNADGLQEEKSLSQLLEMRALENILGKDLLFDLRGLLVEKVGDNFRHLMMHGLLDDDDMESSLPVYFYWLILHMIFSPLDRKGLDLGKRPPDKAA